MPDLPTLAEAISSRAALEQALYTLLEPSTSLREHLVPALSARLESAGSDKRSGNGPAQSKPTAYTDLVDAAEAEVATWSPADKADFLGGHPRIGEVKNLSALSSKEQSGATQTPPEVLAKLEVRLAGACPAHPGRLLICCTSFTAHVSTLFSASSADLERLVRIPLSEAQVCHLCGWTEQSTDSRGS